MTVKEKVIIDTDMGQANDDALSLFMLLNAKHVEVMGVTVVAGNTWAEEGTAYTLRQLEMINQQDVPVYMGAVEPLLGNRHEYLQFEEGLYGNSEYLGAFARKRPSSYLKLEENRVPYWGYPETKPQEQHAVDYIVDTVKKYPHEITLFMIGPATNLALAVKKNPEIIPLIKKVIYMGGAIDIRGNTTPAAEFNCWFDPESAKIVFRSPFKEQILVPNDIAERVFYTKEIYERLTQGEETPIVKMIKDIHGPRFEKEGYFSFVWDVLTVGLFLKPEIVVKQELSYLDVDTNYGPNYGRTVAYAESRRRSFSTPANFPAGTKQVSIIFDIDRETFWDLFIELLTKPMKEEVMK